MPTGLADLGFKHEELADLAKISSDSFKMSAASHKEEDQELLREIYELAWKPNA